MDTSGCVENTGPSPGHFLRWSDLYPFTQGYIEALFADLHAGLSRMDVAIWRDPSRHPERIGKLPGFSDLAPETLARIMADCAAVIAAGVFAATQRAGQIFWHDRQDGALVRCGYAFPPLTPYLGDDGRVYLRDR